MRAEPLEQAERLLATLRGIEQVARLDGGLRIAADPAAAPAINRALVEAGIAVGETSPGAGIAREGLPRADRGRSEAA